MVWPPGTSWNEEAQAVVLPSGESLVAGAEVYGGGGYRDVGAIERVAGTDAAELAAVCVDNTYGEIAVTNNSGSAIGAAE